MLRTTPGSQPRIRLTRMLASLALLLQIVLFASAAAVADPADSPVRVVSYDDGKYYRIVVFNDGNIPANFTVALRASDNNVTSDVNWPVQAAIDPLTSHTVGRLYFAQDGTTVSLAYATPTDHGSSTLDVVADAIPNEQLHQRVAQASRNSVAQVVQRGAGPLQETGSRAAVAVPASHSSAGALSTTPGKGMNVSGTILILGVGAIAIFIMIKRGGGSSEDKRSPRPNSGRKKGGPVYFEPQQEGRGLRTARPSTRHPSKQTRQS